MSNAKQGDTPMADPFQPGPANPPPIDDTTLKQGLAFRVGQLLTSGLTKPTQKEEEKKEPAPPQISAGAKRLQPMTFELASKLTQPRNPTLIASNPFRLQRQPQPLRQTEQPVPNPTKKRTLVDLESDYLGLRPPMIVQDINEDEEILKATVLPSPVFKPDIMILDEEQQKLIEKQQQSILKQDDKQAPAVVHSESVPQKEQFIPIFEEEGPEFASKQTSDTQVDSAEVLIRRENELIELRESLKRKEESEALLDYAFKELKAKLTLAKAEGSRQEMLKLTQQSDLAKKTTFFEFQPNLIYIRDPKGTPLPAKLQLSEDFTTGVLPELDLAFAFSQKEAHFWKTIASNTVISLQFTSDVLSISVQTLQNKKSYILIFTSEELHAYELKTIPAQGVKEQAFKLEKFDVQSSDRLRYNCVHKTKKKGRIFIGGERGQVSELVIETGGNNKGGVVRKMLNKAKNLVLGTAQNQQGSKLKKVDKSLEHESGFFSRLLGSFLYSRKSSQDKVVIDIAEDSSKNLLFVAISGSSTVEIYDLGSKGEDFKSAMTITMDNIVDMVQERVRGKVHYDSSRCDIAKIACKEPGQLTIVLNNGSFFIIQVTVTPPPKNLKQDQPFNPYSIQLLDVVTVNLSHIIQTYQDLFDEFIPNEEDSPNLWKPITAKPLYFSTLVEPFLAQSQCIVKQVEIVGEKVFYLVQGTESYFITVESNQRRGKPYMYTQYLASAKAIQEEFGLSFTVSLDSQLRPKALVMTSSKLFEFNFPSGKDLIYQYLSLLAQNDPMAHKQQLHIYERVKADFHLHLQSQDLLATLEYLIDIVLSQRQRPSERVLICQFAQAYYSHQAKLLNNQDNNQHQFMHRDPLTSYRQGLTHLIQTVANYHNSIGCLEVPVAIEVQEMALQYFIQLTTHAIQFDTNIVTDALYHQAYGAFVRDTAILCKEKLRVELAMRQLACIVTEQLSTKLFKVTKELSLERCASMFTIGLMQERLQHLANIYQTHRVSLMKESVAQESEGLFPFRDQFQAVLKITARLKEGLSIIRELENITQKKDLLKDLPKETRDAIPKLSVEDFLTQGTSNNEVCILLELYFSQYDPLNLDKNGSQYLREATKNFISSQAYSLLLARRYLQAASLLLPCDKQMHYRSLGYNHLRRHSESVNLPIALEELVKNQMPIQALTLCLEAIDNIEAMRKLSSEDLPLGQYQVQQNVAIDLTMLLLSEVYQRLGLEQPVKAVEDKDGDFTFQSLLRRQLNTASRENLLQLKSKMVRMCIKSTSELFHISLYELLLKQKGGLGELKNLRTVHMPRYLDKLNISLDQSVSKSGEKAKQATLTEQQQISLFKSKLEASYNHHLGLKLYGEAFQYLINQLCVNQDAKLEISQRIQWLQKAEGCLINHTEVNSYLSLEQQNYVILMRKFKDYFLIVLQLKDSKKLDEKTKRIVEYSLVNPKDLCVIAMKAKQYALAMQIIEVNELRRYDGEEKHWVDTLPDAAATQNRINEVYRHLITESKAFNIDTKDKWIIKLKGRLSQLRQAAQEFDKTKSETLGDLTFFPGAYVIRLLHTETLKLLSALREQDIKPVSAFWYLDFLSTELQLTLEEIYSVITPIMRSSTEALLYPEQQPEEYFAVAYLSPKVKHASVIGSQINLSIHTATQVLTDALEDELMYPQSYIATVKDLLQVMQGQQKPDLIDKVKGFIHRTVAAQIIPQQ